MKGQVVAYFIVEHAIEMDHEVGVVELVPWKLYFDGSVRNKVQGAGCVIISPRSISISLSIRLEFACTNNQVEYEALLHRLEYLKHMGVRDVDAFGDSQLVVQHVRRESQCLDGILNSYWEQCLGIIRTLDTFSIKHIPGEENREANLLAQQVSRYMVTRGVFLVIEEPIVSGFPGCKGKSACESDGAVVNAGLGVSCAWSSDRLKESRSTPSDGKVAKARDDGSVYEMGKREEDKVSEKQVTYSSAKAVTQAHESATRGSDSQVDWRLPLIECIRNLGKVKDKKMRRQALKYTIVSDELYRRTIDVLLLKCLSCEQARVVAGEVHEGICGAH
jgi:ribonuclease HI